MKTRLQELDGQFCPECDEWIDIEDEGNITCPHCQSKLKAEMSDSDYEDWHLYKRSKMLTPQKLFEALKRTYDDLMKRQWDGSASNYSSTDDYCKACLIDVNPDGEDKVQALCKLPVKKPGSDNIDPEGLQAAAGGRGITQVTKPSDVDQSKWDSAVKSAANTIISNYPKLLDKNAPDSIYEIAGKTPPTERAISYGRLMDTIWNNLHTRDDYSEVYPMDVYFDDTGFYVLCSSEGKLYRYRLYVNGDDITYGPMEQIMEIHQPVNTMRTVIRQQEDGKYRWFSVSGTAVLNRSGEIDSRELFDSFITHAEQTGEYPYRTFYHKGEVFRTGQTDYLARDDYCYLTSGLFDDTPLALASIEAHNNNPDYWGESIGFMPTQEAELTEISNGIKIPVYNQGINIEISDVPQNEAAHLFTRTEVQRMALDGKAWEAFLKLWGDDEDKARKWLEDNPEARNRAIQEAGMITRDTEGVENANGDEATPEIVIDDTVIDAVTRSEVFTNLQQSVTELQATVTQLSDSQNKTVETLTKLVETQDKITERLAKLDKVEAKQERQIADDTPAKFANGQQRVIYRPREAHSNNGEQLSFAEQAQSRIPKGAY